MIHAHDLTFTYTGAETPAVRDLDFEVATGEIFGFLGPSGSGKSTTQKVLIGLLRKYDGKVNVLGRDSRDWGSELYEQVGVGFELPVHFGRLTARENLSYFASLYRGETENLDHLLEQVDLLKEADVRVERFSKGMRVRLSFARAIVCRPKLLFLDEDGRLALGRISPDGFELLASAEVTESISWSLPTLVGTTLYLRDKTAPFFVGGRRELAVEVQVLQLADTGLLALPLEPTTNVGLDWKRRARGRVAHAGVAGIANGWLRYLPHAQDFAHPQAAQHYEILQSTFTPDAAERLLQKGDQLLASAT